MANESNNQQSPSTEKKTSVLGVIGSVFDFVGACIAYFPLVVGVLIVLYIAFSPSGTKK